MCRLFQVDLIPRLRIDRTKRAPDVSVGKLDRSRDVALETVHSGCWMVAEGGIGLDVVYDD